MICNSTATTAASSNGNSNNNNNISSRAAHVNKVNIYSPPASPVLAAALTTTTTTSSPSNSNGSANDMSVERQSMHISSPASGGVSAQTAPIPSSAPSASLCTPKKPIVDVLMLQRLREKLRTPQGVCDLQSLSLHSATQTEPVNLNVIKDRYLISAPCNSPSAVAAAAAKTPASYRHLIDLTCSNLKCTDVFTEEQFLCKIINEPLHKVQRAYFQLQQEGDNCHSALYGHKLIRGVHDIVPLSRTRTYVIISAPQPTSTLTLTTTTATGSPRHQQHEEEVEEREGIYEDLHTYIRNKRRLTEHEARALFHQICQTVQVCHRNGIILRDLKLKRFYFINEARTKLQYESLEGSMILDNPADDTLSDKIGCPLYTAPELLCPKPTYHGKPADMWSLGVILYTMLVGQYPFYEKGNCNLITVIRHCHVQIPASLSKSVRMLLLALLRKNYEERLPADFIFHAPWLKEQRPDYMNIPYDICLSDDDDESGVNEIIESTENDVNGMIIEHHQQHDDIDMNELRYSSRGSNNITSSPPSSTSEPIDYSQTLRMDIDEKEDDHEREQQTVGATANITSRSSTSSRRHGDVDMG